MQELDFIEHLHFLILSKPGCLEIKSICESILLDLQRILLKMTIRGEQD